MKKIKLMLGFLLASANMLCYAAQSIPDPMVQITTPPKGLPVLNQQMDSSHVALERGLFIQGVFISENSEMNKGKNNKVFMNGGFYKVGEIIDDMWKVKSISRKRVVVVNIETKLEKKLNISGE